MLKLQMQGGTALRRPCPMVRSGLFLYPFCLWHGSDKPEWYRVYAPLHRYFRCGGFFISKGEQTMLTKFYTDRVPGLGHISTALYDFIKPIKQRRIGIE